MAAAGLAPLARSKRKTPATLPKIFRWLRRAGGILDCEIDRSVVRLSVAASKKPPEKVVVEFCTGLFSTIARLVGGGARRQ